MIRSQGFLLTVILSGLGYLASPFTFSGLMIFVPHSKHKVMMKHVFLINRGVTNMIYNFFNP